MITSSRSFSIAADAADGRGETRVVETKFGEVEVPADAQRIVALGLTVMLRLRWHWARSRLAHRIG